MERLSTQSTKQAAIKVERGRGQQNAGTVLTFYDNIFFDAFGGGGVGQVMLGATY